MQEALFQAGNAHQKGGRESHLKSIEKASAGLSDEGLALLNDFAEFLLGKYPAKVEDDLSLNPIPRPEEEAVIAAIRRLSKTYPMLDKKILFDQTSSAMSGHILQEVSAKDSIDQLEQVFKAEYQKLLDKA